MLTVHTIPVERLTAAAGRVPGVAAVVVGPEGVRARGAAGWAALDGRVPMSTRTAVPWFSMTKIATATLAVRLEAEGQVDLDEPVAAVVSELAQLRPSAWANRITRRHLLQHTAGLANPLPVRWIHPSTQPGPDQDQMLATLLARNARLRGTPGTRARYSNLGTLVLAASLARQAGAPFETLVRRHVLDPLSMSSTAFDVPAGAPAATGHHPRADVLRLVLPRWVVAPPTGRWLPLRPFAVDGAAYGGLVGTAEDAARLVQMHLADGVLDGTRLLPVAAAREMRRINRQGQRYDLGLGWFRPARDRATAPAFVEHLGGGAGFHNVMRLYPSEGVGVVVMGNATSYDVDAVARLALEHGR